MDLVKHLKKLDRANIRLLDKEVKIGKFEKFPTRLICINLDEAQAQTRRSQARKNGNRNKDGSKETYYLLGWNIFITSISGDILTPQQVYQYYSLRWHIEMMFKNWKSHSKLDKILSSCQGRNYVKPEALFYLCMCFMVLIYNPKFNHFQKIILDRYDRLLSPMKFAQLIINNSEILYQRETSTLFEIIRRNCC